MMNNIFLFLIFWFCDLTHQLIIYMCHEDNAMNIKIHLVLYDHFSEKIFFGDLIQTI